VTDTTVPTFDSDIKPLFRESDRDAMIRAFDLWSFADVKANAEAILGAVRSGSMPCDMEWPEDRVELLQRWIDGAPDVSALRPGVVCSHLLLVLYRVK